MVLCALSTTGFFCASLVSSSSSYFSTFFFSLFLNPPPVNWRFEGSLGSFFWLCIWRVLTFPPLLFSTKVLGSLPWLFLSRVLGSLPCLFSSEVLGSFPWLFFYLFWFTAPILPNHHPLPHPWKAVLAIWWTSLAWSSCTSAFTKCSPNKWKIKLQTTRCTLNEPAWRGQRHLLTGSTSLLFIFTVSSSFFSSWHLHGRGEGLVFFEENLTDSIELRPRLIRSHSENLFHHRLQTAFIRLRCIATSSFFSSLQSLKFCSHFRICHCVFVCGQSTQTRKKDSRRDRDSTRKTVAGIATEHARQPPGS